MQPNHYDFLSSIPAFNQPNDQPIYHYHHQREVTDADYLEFDICEKKIEPAAPVLQSFKGLRTIPAHFHSQRSF